MSDEPRRKLIEVALPLEAINSASAREKSIRHGHPSTLHLWWARRPLAACRAVLFASIVDDPASRPDLFPTEEEQEKERARLFRFVEDLVRWESTTDERILEEARREIRRCLDGRLPAVVDPFCGGGSIPLEAQRLGLDVKASDLNPVAALITRALVEIPPRFKDRPPVHPEERATLSRDGAWVGAQGLASDVRYYAVRMRDEARQRIGHLYPSVRLADGSTADVIAWLWARTVTCANPACRVTLPLVNSFAISRRRNREAWLDPVPGEHEIDFEVRTGSGCPAGGSVSRTGATCLKCGTAIPLKYVRDEARAGRMGAQLLCTIAEGDRRRLYLRADESQVGSAQVARPARIPDTELPEKALGFRVQGYGITEHAQLFTNRQLVALSTFCDLVDEVREQVTVESSDPQYADAVATYLGLTVSRFANRSSSNSFWHSGGEKVEQVFGRNALPMIWVYAEANPFSDSTGNFLGQAEYLVEALSRTPARGNAKVSQEDAAALTDGEQALVATDPPYYDNVPYADLSDFFYIWLRRCLADIHPDLFRTVLVPKAAELIAEPARHGSWEAAARFFEDGLRRAFSHTRSVQNSEFPFTLFYAFKQAEQDDDGGRASTGWERMLEGLLDTGFAITGTWPMCTEQAGGLREVGRNALASSIVLVCRPRLETAALATRKEFTAALRAELPDAMRRLQSGSVAPVDLAQAAIGPGMAIFSRYSRVVEADGKPMRVRTALALINDALDELLAEQEADFDADTRWCVAWFEQTGMNEGPFGVAETLSRAKNTAVNGLVDAGVVYSRAGKVRLLDRSELDATWNPAEDSRLTVWEVTQHLIGRHQIGGEHAAADLLRQVGGGLAETARELAYRLFSICERMGWPQEALAYNALVTAWPEITRLAAQTPHAGVEQQQVIEV